MTVSGSSSLRRDFDLLQSRASDDEQWTAMPLDRLRTPEGHAEIALDATGQRHLLIPIAASRRVARDNRSAGIQVGPYTLVDGRGKRRQFLDIVCRKAHLHDVFCTIADEMLEAIVGSPEAPGRAAIRVLDRWRDLLAGERRDGPSLEMLAGLYGELWHVREIARLDPSAVSVWQGPSGTSHDLRLGPLALEVKTTRKVGWRVSIAGLHQLEIPADGQLYLSIFRLEASEGGEAFRDLVASLLELGADGHFIHSKLAEGGVGPSHLAQSAGAQAFEILDHRVYRVEGDFPRVTKGHFVAGDLPPGVAGLKYQVDLTAWGRAPLTAEELDILHTAFAKG